MHKMMLAAAVTLLSPAAGAQARIDAPVGNRIGTPVSREGSSVPAADSRVRSNAFDHAHDSDDEAARLQERRELGMTGVDDSKLVTDVSATETIGPSGNRTGVGTNPTTDAVAARSARQRTVISAGTSSPHRRTRRRR